MARWWRQIFKSVGRWGFTVMVVPKRGSVRRLHIPWLGIILVGCGLLSLGLFLGYSIWYYPYSHSNIIQLKAANDRLRRENAQIKPALSRAKELEKLINHYQKIMTEIEQTFRAIQKKSPPGRLSSRAGSIHAVALYRLPPPVKADQEISFLATLEVQTASLRQEIDQRITAAERLQRELLAYEYLLDHTPSLWPVRGRLTSRFGYRRDPFNGKTAMHTGMDLAVPVGTPVRAAAAGRVVEAGWQNGYGWTVRLDHGYGYQTLYGHNSRLLVKVGQRVVKGQIIAYSGSSGRSTAPHLHYEVRVNGRVVNPRDYLW